MCVCVVGGGELSLGEISVIHHDTVYMEKESFEYLRLFQKTSIVNSQTRETF